MRRLDPRVFVARLMGKPVFELPYYRESETKRLLNLFARVDLDRWRAMRVLEVGAGLGHIGDVFAQLGFDVTSTDGRPEHVEAMKARGRKAFVLDLDRTGVHEVGDFDLILAFGVLYHLAEPAAFLNGCGRRASVLLLETAVKDALDESLDRVSEPSGWWGTDQALGGTGCRPSPLWVENACRAAGFDEVRDISSSVGNWSTGRFDWEPRGTGVTRIDGMNLRKMWVCEKRSVHPG